MKYLTSFCVLSFLAFVARSNSSTGNTTRRETRGPSLAIAAAAAEGRLVFIGNDSYVRVWRLIVMLPCRLWLKKCTFVARKGRREFRGALLIRGMCPFFWLGERRRDMVRG